jgi:hypothetical protein
VMCKVEMTGCYDASTKQAFRGGIERYEKV